MTDDSELPPPAPAAEARPDAAPTTTPTPREPVVLARGHLHPRILLLRLLDAIQQVVVLFVLGVVFEPWFLIAAIVLFVLRLGGSLALYLTLEYTLTDEELRIREGILERQERRIPLDRIQDLGFESTLLRRFLGLSVVLVETASGRGVEARLDALSRADADHLRDVLLAARRARAVAALPAAASVAAGEASAVGDPVAEPSVADEPEWLVHQATSSDLVVRGLTDLRLSAFVVTGFAALQFAEQFGLGDRVAGLAGALQRWLEQFSPAMLALLLASLLLAVMAFGVVTATIGNLVQFHGFALTLRGDVLQRRFGLLTTRSKTLPRSRVQRVTLEQPWLRRLVGVCVVKADSAGGSRAQGEDNTSGWDVVAPLVRGDAAEAMLPALLPGLERATFAWRRGSPRLVLRTAIQGVILAAILAAGMLAAASPWWWTSLLLVPIWFLLGVLTYRNLAFANDTDFLALQHGIVGRYLAYVPLAKVQAAVLRQGPIAQLLGLAELTVFVAGGSPTRIPNLTAGDARQLAAQIAARAAEAAHRDG